MHFLVSCCRLVLSPKFVDNQLSSRRFRGLASDCFCHHRIHSHSQSRTYILSANNVTVVLSQCTDLLERVVQHHIVFVAHLEHFASSHIFHAFSEQRSCWYHLVGGMYDNGNKRSSCVHRLRLVTWLSPDTFVL